jgi:signal transduction histidine kinase
MTRLLQSTPFRVALLLGAAFVAAFIVAGLVAFGLIEHELDQRTDQRLIDAFKVIAQAYGEQDQADLIDSVRAHASSAVGHEQLYGLADQSGRILAGNITALPPIDGWTTTPSSSVGLDAVAHENYRIYIGVIGTDRILVGSSFAETREIAAMTLGTLALAGVAIIVIVVVIGGALAVRAQRRIDSIASIMSQVGQGELHSRIPVGRRADDIDHLARQVNAALDRLSALVEGMRQVSVNIAHDLKTPLNRLAITVETALNAEERGEPVATQLTQAQVEIQQVNSTFDALLRIAQIEAGTRRARFVPLQLSEILDRIVDAYADVADEQGQSLEVRHDATLPNIEGDRELLTQLCANLVENSIRHCPAGTAIIASAASANDRLTVSFADNGPGIPSEEHEKVFQRLYRVEKSRTTSGNGLGLSLVKAIADLHGATIAIGNLDPGLFIRIEFPISRSA